MGGTENVTTTSCPGKRIIKGLRVRRDHYECDLCRRVYRTEPGLWAHRKDCPSNVCPDDEYNQEQLRARKRQMCSRKLSDKSACPEPQQPPPSNLLPASVPAQARQRFLGEAPDPGDPRTVSWGLGCRGVHETESGTSHVTLYQPDTRMPLAPLLSTAHSSSTERPATPAPHNVSRGFWSPERPGSQSVAPPSRRDFAPVRGDLTSDPEFDRPTAQADVSPTNEGYMPIETVTLTPRLYDTYSDVPGAPSSREGGQMMTLESCGQYFQPPQQPETYLGEGQDIRMVAQPETQPISPEQLMAEVMGILAWLLTGEAKYSGVHAATQSPAYRDGYQPKLNNGQLKALMALHRTLLHEHHEFFFASQYPNASASWRQPPPQYPFSAHMRFRQRPKGPRNQRGFWRKINSHSRRANRGRRRHYGG